MPDSIFTSLLSTLDKATLSDTARALGQPEQSVSSGMQTSIAALLGGMASKSQDSGTLQKVLDTVSATDGNVSWTQMASGLTTLGSPLMIAGKRVLSTLFGSDESAVVDGISGASGLTAGAASTLLSMAAPVVMSYLTRRLRDGRMNIGSLGSLLQRESGTIRNALPASLSEMFWPGAVPVGASISPVVAQTVQREKSTNWLPLLAVAGLGLGLLWLFAHARRPSIVPVAPPVASGTANRMAIPAPAPLCSVPSNVSLPEGGAAARLLAFAQSPDTKPADGTWLDIDQMVFETGSAKVPAGSQPQLDYIASVLTNCPNVHLNIAGYTDNVGTAESNLRLSENRANAVVAQLASKGVSRSRLTSEGHGEENPTGDNSTEEGRSQNRRVAMRVTEK